MIQTFRCGIALAAILWGAVPVVAQQPDGNAGAYLAGNAAAERNDFEAATGWFGIALTRDSADPALIENFLASAIGAGHPGDGLDIARTTLDIGVRSQLANMLLAAGAARTGTWSTIFDTLEADHGVSPLVDGLTRAWAQVGQGNMDAALAAFDDTVADAGMRPFGLYHKALALAFVGDFEAAEAILATTPEEGLPMNRRSVAARAQVLSQLGRNAEAAALIDRVIATQPDDDPGMLALRDQVSGDAAIPFVLIGDARDGVAEVYLTIASILDADTPAAYVLLYARIAQWLAPDDADITLLTAGLLERLGNTDLAAEAYGLVAPGDPAFLAAELGRASVLNQSGQTDLSVEVLEQLIRAYPDQAAVRITLADTLRRADRSDAARSVYTDALAMLAPDDTRAWFVHYMRAVTAHRLDDWPAAEADLRAALDLNPDHPQILNYLGYSLVERGESLDEALAMIERAVAAEPENGAIVDSLGWALYVIGRTDEAVEPLERAAELEPVDAVINDHLGDAYWDVGRVLEARFQWRRALSFDPEPEAAERLRRKLAQGLDAVRAEDANADVDVAQDP